MYSSLHCGSQNDLQSPAPPPPATVLGTGLLPSPRCPLGRGDGQELQEPGLGVASSAERVGPGGCGLREKQ